MNKKILFFFILISCEKEISLDFPSISPKLVVEGSIENGFPPVVILTKNAGYFDNIDTNTYNNLFVNDAIVKVWKTDENGINDTIELIKIPNYPIYTHEGYWNNLVFLDKPFVFESLFFKNWSKSGHDYNLHIEWNNKTITASTTIPEPTKLDCLWVIKDLYSSREYKYDIKGIYNDPIEQENNYLIKTRRSQHFKIDSLSFNSPILKNNSDKMIHVVDVGSDILFNGLKYETIFARKTNGNIASGAFNSYRIKTYNNNLDTIEIPEDIVTVKFCQIDRNSLEFWRSLTRQFSSNGNPFQEPANLISNINGGYGCWSGYGSVYYRIEIKDGFSTNSPLPIDSIEITDVF